MSDDSSVRPVSRHRCRPMYDNGDDVRGKSDRISIDRFYSAGTADAISMEPAKFTQVPADAVEKFQPLELPQAKRPPLKIITANGYMLDDNWEGIPDWLRKLLDIPKMPVPKKRSAQLARWMKSQRADVVAVQELFSKNLFKKIAKESGYKHKAFFPERQLAIYSKHPIKHSKFHKFSWQSPSNTSCIAETFFGRRYGFGVVEIDYDGDTIYVANFHGLSRLTDSSKVGVYRDRQTPQRLSHFLEAKLALEEVMRSGKPIILTGDFNFNPTYKEYEFFKRLFGDKTTDALSFSVSMGLYTGQLSTFSANNPWARDQKLPDEGVLDYVFVSGAQVLDAWIDHPDPAFSDHWPVGACVEVEQSKEPPMCMAKTNMKGLGIGLSQVESLIQYFQKIEVPSFCMVSDKPDLISQRKRILAVLKKVRKRVVRERGAANLSQLSNYAARK